MRPCQSCGTPIENAVDFCNECAKLDLPTETERVEQEQQEARRQQRIANGRQAEGCREKDATDKAWVARILRWACIPFLLVAILMGFGFGIETFFLATLIESLLVLAWLGLLKGLEIGFFGAAWFRIGLGVHVGCKPPLTALAVMFLSWIALIFAILSQPSDRLDKDTSYIPVPIFQQVPVAV